MLTPSLTKDLRGAPLFADLPTESSTCFALVRLGEEVCLQPNERLHAAGLFVVVEGLIRFDGSDVPLGPGRHFGEVALLTGSTDPDVIGIVKSRLFRLPPDLFEEVVIDCARFTRRLLTSLAGCVGRAHDPSRFHPTPQA